jgi:hypothetical protein
VSADPWEQLYYLRGLTRRTGALHEAQVVQLRRWPLLVAPHASSCEFAWDSDTKTIEFRLRLIPGKRAPANLAKRLKVLDGSVKLLLGEDCLVRVRAGSRTLYTGRRKAVVGEDWRVTVGDGGKALYIGRKNKNDTGPRSPDGSGAE